MNPTKQSTMAGLLLAVGVVATGVWLAVPARRSDGRGKDQARPALRSNTVVQAFPARGFDAKALANPANPFDEANYRGRDTVWVVEWDITAGTISRVLRVTAAHFGYLDRNGARRWITVLQNLELGEIFAPYDDHSHQFEDIAGHHFHLQPADKDLLGPPCLAPGEILTSDRPGMSGLVYKEVHDDGVRLIDMRDQDKPDRGRRGEKMTLWVNFNAANYRYLIEYGFSDDGVLSARIGGDGLQLLRSQASEPADAAQRPPAAAGRRGHTPARRLLDVRPAPGRPDR